VAEVVVVVMEGEWGFTVVVDGKGLGDLAAAMMGGWAEVPLI
jgi:hypothetical protein